MQSRRTLIVGLGGLVLLPLGGCATQPPRPLNPDGTYCFVFGKYGRYRTCTAQPVPTDAVEKEALRFEPESALLTVYVVRRRWTDKLNQVPISVDGSPPVATVPNSVVRVRLRPGRHHITLKWEGVEQALDVEGRAGDIRYVQLAGFVSTWGTSYKWESGSDEDARARASKSKLIADLRLV